MSKVKIILFVLISLVTISASARHGTRHSSYDGMLRKGFHMGVTGSGNSTWILKQNNYNTLNLFTIPIVRQSEMDYTFTWGGQAGVELGYNFSKRWGIQFDPSFSWAGQNYDDNFTGPVAAKQLPNGTYVPDGNPLDAPYFSGNYSYINVRRQVKFTYFQLPLYARFQTVLGDIANFYFMAGPQLNILHTASEKVYINNIQYIDTNNFSPDKKFKNIDIGMSINTGVDIYTSQTVYFDIGIVSFIAFNDLNGDALKNLGWYSKNDIGYEKSHNFYLGIHAGIHVFLKKQYYY